eukprot:820164_1
MVCCHSKCFRFASFCSNHFVWSQFESLCSVNILLFWSFRSLIHVSPFLFASQWVNSFKWIIDCFVLLVTATYSSLPRLISIFFLLQFFEHCLVLIDIVFYRFNLLCI